MGEKRNGNEFGVYGPESLVVRHSFKNWILKKIAGALAFVELVVGAISIIPSIQKKKCDTDNCASITCSLMSSDNYLERFVGNDLNIHGILMDKTLEFIGSIDVEINVQKDEEDEQVLTTNEDIEKVKKEAINDLKRLGLISDNSINFTVEDFRSLRMSLKNIGDINAISQIYAYELAVRDYDNFAVDDFYKGIKCRYEDRYYESKEDFITSIGCQDESTYKNMVEEYIVSKNGDINLSRQDNIRLSSGNYRLVGSNSYIFNNEDRGQSLVDILKEEKQAQSYNMSSKALGSYQVKRLYR